MTTSVTACSLFYFQNQRKELIKIAISLSAYATYKATGTQTEFTIPFDYLRSSFVYVDLDGVNQTGGFYVFNGVLTFTTPPAKDTTVTIYRNTPTERLVSWQDASILKAKDLTLAEVQQLHLIEENKDYMRNNAVCLDDTNSVWQGKGLRIENVADPVNDQDVVTKHYIESNFMNEHVMPNIDSAVREVERNTASNAANAATSETNAAKSAKAAATSETNAANSAKAAATSEINAASSRTSAASSASSASTSEKAAANSAANAATSETNAAKSKTSAATSETNAANSAKAAATSETNAANSAKAAATSETNAAKSLSSIGASETNAANSAKAAATSETNAKEYARQAQAAAYPTFTGATTTSPGTSGLVPSPTAGSSIRYLCSDGTWKEVDLDSAKTKMVVYS